MLKLIQFFLKHRIFFLFLLLEIVALSLTVQKRSFHRSVFTSSSNVIAGSVWQLYAEMSSYFHLGEANQQLLNENVKLHNLLEQLQLDGNVGQLDSINDTILSQRYTFKKAEVIHNSFTKRNNYLTLNIGSRHGVEEGAGVIGPNGVVGIVDQVTKNFSSVISILHERSRISARLKNSNYFGSCIWNGRSHSKAQVVDIPREANFSIGDSVITNSYSSIFPEGISIGKIAAFELKPEDNFYTIELELATNFANLSHVYVIQNLQKQELQQIEEEREDEQ